MRHIVFCILLLQSAWLIAGVKVFREVNSEESQIITVENELMTAKFSSLGARLILLFDKTDGKHLVSHPQKDISGAGAFRDLIAPSDYRIAKTQFIVEGLKEADDEVQLVFKTPPLPDDLYFIRFTKVFTIKSGSSLINCDLSISNKTESMSTRMLQYWSHNYVGSEGEENRFFAATENGIIDYVPSGKTDLAVHAPVRNYICMLGQSGTGVVMLPEFRRLDSTNTWYCKYVTTHDTLEWKYVPEKIPSGSELKTRFSLGIVKNMHTIGGAGNAGYGAFDIAEKKLRLSAFSQCDAVVVISLDGKTVAESKVALAPGRISEIAFDTQIPDRFLLTAVVRTEDGSSFDIIASNGIKIPSKEEKRKSDENNGDWQFQWSDEFKTPHFKWIEGSPFKVLFLLPTNGIRNCIELKQRMPIRPTIPTLYPNSWQMSWRVQTDTMSGEKTGLRFLPQYFGKSDMYDVIVIGGDGYVQKNKHRVIWKDFPETVRKGILERVRNGAGLVLINPTGTDPDLDGIIKGLEALPEVFAASMDYSAAPHFPKTTMSTGMLGNGRIICINYPNAGFIAPHPGNMKYDLQLLTQSHRFQEYQFAVLARLVNYARGVEPTIKSVKVDNGILKIASNAGRCVISIFDRWSEPRGIIKAVLVDGETKIQLPDHGEGRFYIHVTKDDDFGFAVYETKGRTEIKTIKMAKSFAEGVHAIGKIEAMGMEANDELQSAIYDNLGRIVWQGKGMDIDWDCANAVVSRHILKSHILRDGKVISEKHHEFYLPDVWENEKHFNSNAWGGFPYPEYAFPYLNDQIWKLGATFIFNSRNEECSYLFNFSNMESGMNWIASYSMFHNEIKNFYDVLDKWSKTGDKRFLVKPCCPSNPSNDKLLSPSLPDRMKLWGTRHFFHLGDEMSMGWYDYAYDLCFCEYCLKGMHEEMKQKYGTLAALNTSWATDFKNWDEVMPMTYDEVFLHSNPAPWVEHRLYMDKVYIQALTKIIDRINAEYPNAWVGPTGTNSVPAVYGGNSNFWNSRNINYPTFYGTPRIPLSFNRERIVMSHNGYSTTEINTRFNLMEQIFAGNKGMDTWWSPIFILPDLRISDIRKYYKDLTWECRNGFGEILFHSTKVKPKVAILHSQAALISNFMKQKKTGYYEKELAYAKVLEDLGIPYRFIAPAEIGRLDEFEALFLPETTAMSDAEIVAVKSFKGVVIADYEIATQNELCVRREIPALDDFFGVKTGLCKLKKVKKHNIPGVTITSFCKGIKPAGGTSLYEADGEPLVIVNGKAVMLNFSPLYNTNREVGFRKLIAGLLNVKPAIELETEMAVMQTFYEHGDTQYICLLPEPHGVNWSEQPFKSMEAWRKTAKLRLPKAVHIYDVREGIYLGNGREFDIELTPAFGKMLAVLPNKSAGFDVELPSVAKAGTLVPIKISAERRHHVWLMTIDNHLEYRKIQSADGGWNFILPLAFNDYGVLNVKVRDAVTGEERTMELNVLKGD